MPKFRLKVYNSDWFGLHPWTEGCPEGNAKEWTEVLNNLKQGKRTSFKRLEAVPLVNGDVYWSSPRNSNGIAMLMCNEEKENFVKKANQTIKEASKQIV